MKTKVNEHLTHEEVDRLVEAVDLGALTAKGAVASSVWQPAVWTAVRAVLLYAIDHLVADAKWALLLTYFVGAGDASKGFKAGKDV